MDYYEQSKQAERGAWISLSAYIFLSTIKLIIGFTGNSEALRADGLNNATDVLASVAVIIGLKISRKPPDPDHQYGHFRAESISSLIASFIMFMIGLQVLFEAGKSIFAEEMAKPDILTGIVALGSAVFMWGIYVYNLKLSQKTESHSLYAAAQDNRSDALVSLGAFVGIIGAQLGLYWLDPLAALIVGLIILKTAIEIFRDASHSLTDGFEPGDLDKFHETILSVENVKEIKELKARSHGNKILLDVTILVDSGLTVKESHEATDKIEERLEKEHNIINSHIHIEPYE
ncbi:cation diffusion facilitator family transporter [Metabacillus arenae]|uniref:Cation transporter n=1 Tax=Metabacillus arenae TaxID=2771434 RepID=A0A926NEX2_9BACI|nr:cation diffusion facilitator family transporter [Metabacillus arenae]MBD1382229.1 cation transporter [Metabacillus arenae]